MKELEQKYISKMEEEDKKFEGIIKTKYYDEENYHGNYDDLLCEFLEELGYKEIVKKYKEAEKHFWYA